MSEYLLTEDERLTFAGRDFNIKHVEAVGSASGGRLSDGFAEYVRNVFHPKRLEVAQLENKTNLGKISNDSSKIDELNFLPKTGINFEALTTPSKKYKESTYTSTPISDTFNFDGFGTVRELAPQNISAITMLRMENKLGKEAIDDSLDKIVLKTSLESIYEELGINRITRKNFSNYPVYTPKSSREYLVQKNSYVNPLSSTLDSSLKQQDSYKSYREKSDEKWRKSNRQMLIDYKDFDSSPLSPYMYRDHNYVQSQDSRIVGSNFVQVTTRPRDRFLDKIDETLAKVRSMPRY